MTQDDLAVKLNVKRHSICDWESGRTEPNVTHIQNIAEIFNITTDYLLGVDNWDSNVDHIILTKFKTNTPLEHNLLSRASEMSPNQQERFRSIISNLKNFHKGE